jgi:hypothetical protein
MALRMSVVDPSGNPVTRTTKLPLASTVTLAEFVPQVASIVAPGAELPPTSTESASATAAVAGTVNGVAGSGDGVGIGFAVDPEAWPLHPAKITAKIAMPLVTVALPEPSASASYGTGALSRNLGQAI